MLAVGPSLFPVPVPSMGDRPCKPPAWLSSKHPIAAIEHPRMAHVDDRSPKARKNGSYAANNQ